MQAQSIAECSKGSILQYFRPSLSYHLPLRPFFCLFLTQVLLYAIMIRDEQSAILSQKNLSVESYNVAKIRWWHPSHTPIQLILEHLLRIFSGHTSTHTDNSAIPASVQTFLRSAPLKSSDSLTTASQSEN